MEMDNSLQSTLNQLVTLQQQQLNVMSNIDSKQNLPNANFMSSYANYSQNYMPPMFPTTPSGVAAQEQYKAYAAQLSGNDNYSFMDTLMLNKSRYSNETRNMIVADYGARASNAAISAGGAAAGGLASFAAGAILPGITGMGAGIVGGAVIGGLFDIGLQQNQQQQAYNKYLLKESYRFINPSESRNERDITGFSTTERHDASNFLRKFGTTNRVTDQETMMLLQKYTEGGLLKEVSDLKTFKEKMKQLTDSVKTSALLLNETFDSISNLMSEMKKSGMDLKNFDYLAAKGKLIGSQMGLSGSQTVRSMMGIASGMTQGTAYDINNMMNRAGDNLLYMNQLYDTGRNSSDPRMQMSYRLISNYGGAEQATAQMMQAQNAFLSNSTMGTFMGAMFKYNSSTGQYEFDTNTFNKTKSGNYSLNDLAAIAAKNVGVSAEATAEWYTHKDMYISSLTQEQQNAFTRSAIDMYKKQTPALANSSSDVVLKYLGMGDSNMRMLYGNILDYEEQDNGSLRRNMQTRARQQELLNKVNANRPGLYYDMKTAWEGFKDKLGDNFAGAGDWISDMSMKINDKLYGRTYSNLSVSTKDLTSSGLQSQRQELGQTLINEVKKGIQEAQGKGFNLGDDIIKLFEASMGKVDEKLATSIHYKRTVINDAGILDSNTKKYFGQIKSSAEENRLSETLIAALTKFGMSSGNNFMGMTNDTIGEISKRLNVNVMGLGNNGKIDAASDYLGKLTTAYGGNQDMALAAYMTSQDKLDAMLLKAGINMKDIRESGNWSELKNVEVQKIIDSHTREIINNVNNNMPGIGGTGSSFKNGSKGKVTEKYYNEINQTATKYGLDANSFATLFGVENPSGDASAMSRNSDGSYDIGLGQLNTSGGIATLIKNGFQSSDGTSFSGLTTQQATDLLMDPTRNIEATAYIWSGAMRNAKGNQYLAAAMYNGGTSRIWNLFKGLSEDEIKKLTPEQIQNVLRSQHEGWANNVSNYVGKFSGIEGSGKLVSPANAITQEDIVTDKNGNLMSVEDRKKAIVLAGGNVTSYKSAFENPWDLRSIYDSMTKDKIDFTGNDKSKKSFGHGYLPKVKIDEDKYTNMFGDLFKIARDGKSDFKYRQEVMGAISNNYTQWIDEMNEYKSLTGESQSQSKWSKRSSSERAEIMQTMQMIQAFKGDDLGLKGFNPLDYLTSDDNTEYGKIKKGKHGKIVYDSSQTGTSSNYANYTKWLMGKGLIESDDNQKSVSELSKIVDKKVSDFEKQQKEAGDKAYKLINSGELSKMFGGDADAIKNAMLTGDSSKIKEKINALTSKRGKKSESEEEILSLLNEVMGISDKIGASDLGDLMKYKKAIGETSTRAKDIAKISSILGTALGMSNDFVDEQNKRQRLEENDKTKGGKSLSQYEKEEVETKAMIEKALQTTSDLKKVLTDNLGPEIAESLKTAGLITEDGKIGTDAQGQSRGKELVDAVFNALGVNDSADDTKKKIDDAKSASDDLTATHQDLLKTVNDTVKNMRSDIDELKSSAGLQQRKSSSNFLHNLFYGNGE